jgi:multiple sugar transport system permease protein
MTTQTLDSRGTPIPTIPTRRPLLSKQIQEWFAGFVFVLPALLVVIIFVFIPMIYAFFISFTNWTGLQPPAEAQNIGLDNYRFLLADNGIVRTQFFQAVKNTVYYVLGVVPLQTILALLLAIIVNQKFLKGRGFFRTAFYLPSITSSIVISMIFLWLFNRNGIINYFIGQAAAPLGGYNPITWLNDPNGLIHNLLRGFGLTLATAPEWMKTEILGQTVWAWISGPSVTMSTIMLLNIWTTSGTLMLIFLAALQDIPGQLYEAASVDGASRWQQFRNITLPTLRPTTFFVITIGLIGTFQVFDQVYVISKGAPAGTTSTIAWQVYRNAFRDSQAGLGSATAFVLFVLILGFTLIQRRLVGSGERQRG